MAKQEKAHPMLEKLDHDWEGIREGVKVKVEHLLSEHGFPFGLQIKCRQCGEYTFHEVASPDAADKITDFIVEQMNKYLCALRTLRTMEVIQYLDTDLGEFLFEQVGLKQSHTNRGLTIEREAEEKDQGVL